MNKVDIAIHNLVGMSLEDAENYLKTHEDLVGYFFRLVFKDGKYFMGTDDLLFNRINIHVVDNIITEAETG